MTPKELKDKHHLTYSKLAVLLNKDVRTVERYCSQGKHPDYLATFCFLMDFYLQSSGGSVPPTIWN